MNISVYIYILKRFLAFIAGSRPYWKLAFYNINDRVAYLNKVNLSSDMAQLWQTMSI